LSAALRVAVDGGTNFLPRDPKFKPDIISGDFDSVEKSAIEYFSQLDGCRIIPTPDQDETDFTKAVQIVSSQTDLSIEYIVAITGIAGRPDHLLSNFHTLFKSKHLLPVILLDPGFSVSCALDSVSFLSFPFP
jgi:thiamine pyrophosphokinase